jgi:hypothetical protein
MIPAKERAAYLIVNYQLNIKSLSYEQAKKCAAYAVGTILDEYQSISDLESTLVVNGQVMSIVDKIVYWNEVKQQIQKL